MTRRISITSTSNDRLKAVRRLRRRGDRTMLLVEGHRQLRSALEAGAPIREVYAAPGLFLGTSDVELVALAERCGARIHELSDSAFASISGQVRPDGLVAMVERRTTGLVDLPLPSCPLFVVAESIERPGNLGTIVRTAGAAGADALIVSDARTDVFHPEAVRGSVGMVFSVALAETTTDVARAWLREHGIRVVVATPDGGRPHWEGDYGCGTAIVLGNERYGVGEAWLEAADETVRIPMPGPADSLNVAVAAGIVLFEAARQRAATATR